MPMKLTIEIIKHSENDLRVIVNDNGKISRHRFDDCVYGLLRVQGIIPDSKIHKDSVFWQDAEGRRYPVSFHEWLDAQPKGNGVWCRG